MRSRSKLVVVALFGLSLFALAVCFGRPASAALPSDEASVARRRPASAPRQMRGAEASQFLRESGIDESLGAAAGGYVEQAKLLASDGAAQDSHGFSVAVSGDTAVVGAPADQVGANSRQGSAYVYTRSGTTWTQQQKLTASDGVANDEFGYAVAIGGDSIFVGRHFTQVGNTARTRGAVYVFTRSGATWTQAPTQLVSGDIADGDLFGSSLAYDNGTLVVGALQKNSGVSFFRGAAYVFTGSGATFTEQAKLLSSDGGFADFFGFSVAVSGDTAVVGATGLAGAGAAGGRGWAYVFTRNGSGWTQQQKLQSSDGAPGDAFGYSVGVSGDTAVIGARADVVGTSGEVGSAYLFQRTSGVWAEQQKLTAQEPTPRNDFFGNGVAIRNDTVVVGSPAHESLPSIANHGAVYVFNRSGATWTRSQKLIHGDAAPDALGQAVAFDGSSILAGAPAKSSTRGAAYVFALEAVVTPTPTPTPAPTPTQPGTVSFSSATFEAGEGGGGGASQSGPAASGSRWAALASAQGSAAAVTVTRTDASQSASVDYATESGTASDRSDYVAAYGTLRFEPGETSKSFAVHITDDAFQETVETFSVVLSNPVGVSLGSPSSATINVTSNDAVTGASPVKGSSFDVDFFVRQHYADFLGRAPDPAGLDFWKNSATNCGAADVLVCRINVSAAFFLSIEHQETGYLVHRAYKVAFGNLPGKPVPLTLREYLSGSRQVGDGVEVNVGNWRQRLEANKEAFFNQFVNGPRFTAVYDGLTNAQYVDALNQNAGGALTQAERDALVSALNGGTQTRARVLRAVAEDPDLAAAEKNRAFVLAQYFGYLRRNPDDTDFSGVPDPNFDGYNHWLQKLDQFNGNFVEAEMVRAFIESIEYGGRFGQ